MASVLRSVSALRAGPIYRDNLLSCAACFLIRLLGRKMMMAALASASGDDESICQYFGTSRTKNGNHIPTFVSSFSKKRIYNFFFSKVSKANFLVNKAVIPVCLCTTRPSFLSVDLRVVVVRWNSYCISCNNGSPLFRGIIFNPFKLD